MEPMALAQLRGRILDLDSHIQFPPAQLAELFGDTAARAGRYSDQRIEERLQPLGFRGASDADVDEVSVWHVKGHDALGAWSPEGRLAALDLMGIARQLIFPRVVVALAAWSDRPSALEVMRRHNDVVIAWTKSGHGRLVPAALVNVNDVEVALAEARRVIAAGARAMVLPFGRPPAGVSPAASVWDPFWRLLAAADVPALLHVGGHFGFIDPAWGRIEYLAEKPLPGNEDEATGPLGLATKHLSAQNYLASMIFGGVFERHPCLRFGIVELGAQWLGPLAESLDQRFELFRKRLSEFLSLRPSDYIRRQVRITPYHFEPTAKYVERYGMAEVYAFSTDYPHPEGGTRPLEDFYASVRPLGDEGIEAFFVRNAELILPA